MLISTDHNRSLTVKITSITVSDVIIRQQYKGVYDFYVFLFYFIYFIFSTNYYLYWLRFVNHK